MSLFHDLHFSSIHVLDCGKIIQENFVNSGLLRFCCKNKLCIEAQKQAKVTMNFVRVKSDLEQNLNVKVSLGRMGFQQAEFEIFKVRLVHQT